MVLNKQRAEIQIGREQGYLGGTITTETNTQQSVEFLKTGTILRLRPYIAHDGLIRMEVHPELSSGEVVTKEGTALPDKEVTQVTSNVMVANGCTVIIGGLMRNELSNSGRQIPYLGNLPWVGGLFRTRNGSTERHEVLVLITPRIVHDCDSNAEARTAGGEFERRQALYAEKMNVFGKRHVARRYLRMAQEAWACGNRDRALRFAELAVHFDPQSLEAIELRSQIWNNGGGHASTPGKPAAPSGGNSTPLDGQTMAPWLLEGLENPMVMAPSPQPDAPAPPKYKAIQRPRSVQ
jgi:type IV pilus assembly protein PilQ